MKPTGNIRLAIMARPSTAWLGLGLLFMVLLFPVAASADGGLVRMRATQGSFIITIFTPPEIVRDQPTDVTVLVQSRESGEVVLDAVVDLSFTPPVGATLDSSDVLCGATTNLPSLENAGNVAPPPSIPALRARAANKLLYGTVVILRAVGDWQVRATVRQGGETVSVACALPVAVPPRQLAGLWPYLALPPLAIVLFALNQYRRQARGGRKGSESPPSSILTTTDAAANR